MKRKRRQECCGYCEKCITIGLSITRFRCTRFSRQKVSGKPDAESLGTTSKSTIHWVYVMSCEYPGKQRTIVRKSNVKNPHQRSPQRYKNLRTDLKKRLKVNSDAPKARHGIFLKTKTNSKKGTRLHSSRPRKNGYSRLRQQESRRKESLQLIQEQVCTRSVRKALTLLSWRPWRHRGILRRWWRQRGSHCFLKKLPQFFLFFLLGSSARIMGILTTGPAVKNHISPKKKARELIAIYRTTYHSLSWFIDEFLHVIYSYFSNAHNRILWLARKIQQQKEVEVWA